MNFTTDPRKLASAVSWAARRVPTRPDVPILAGILIELTDDAAFTGFDFEVSATATLTPDAVEGWGRCVVSGRLLAELVKSLPSKPVTIAVDDEQMTLTCGPVRATLPLMPAEDYPSLPTAPEPIGRIHAEDFAKQLGRVLPACDITGQIASLPPLTGVHIAFGDDHLRMAATNRYQLATAKAPGWTPNPAAAEQHDFPVLVPGAVLAEVLKVCDFDGPLEIGAEGGAVSFSTGARVITARTLPVNEFPGDRYARLFPPRSATPTVIDTDEVTTAFKRTAAVLEPGEAVTLEFLSDRLVMRAGHGRGQVTADLWCDHTGPDVAVSVNPHFFAPAIVAAGERAELSISTPRKPLLVTAPKDDDYLHVVMPIRSPS